MEDRSHITTESPNRPDSYQHHDGERHDSHHEELDSLRREYASEYSILHAAVQDDEDRRVLAALVNHGGMTYDELDGTVALSQRRMKDRVFDLEEKGIVETTDSYVSIVHFRNDDIKLLAEDALSFFFE